MAYRSLTKTVEAIRWSWEIDKVLSFMGNRDIFLDLSFITKPEPVLSVKTVHGMQVVPLGGWIIKNIDGSYEVMNGVEFDKAYEEITDSEPDNTNTEPDTGDNTTTEPTGDNTGNTEPSGEETDPIGDNGNADPKDPDSGDTVDNNTEPTNEP